MIKKRLDYLHERYARGQATEEELDELKSLVVDLSHESDMADWLDSMWEEMDDKPLSDMSEDRSKIVLARILKQDRRGGGLRRMIIWSAAAVMVISSVVLHQYWVPNSKPVETVSLAHAEIRDIEPGTHKAILTLADGRQIILNGYEEEHILDVPTLKISKEADNMLVYLPSDTPAPLPGMELEYNTLTTPTGGQYQVMLPDGTKVMLNAASRLRYPQRFPQNERFVEFEGEGYFEVQSDPDRPFVVKTISEGLEQEVRVLGTEFNINSYDLDQAIVTTVVGGRVAVSNEGGDHVLLGSGQQSVFQSEQSESDGIQSRLADINETMAWKDGLFVFNNEPLPSLLKRVSRWYDVTFVYEDDLADVVFQGNYFRNKGLLNLLANLEEAGRVQFQIDQTYADERRIYVMKN